MNLDTAYNKVLDWSKTHGVALLPAQLSEPEDTYHSVDFDLTDAGLNAFLDHAERIKASFLTVYVHRLTTEGISDARREAMVFDDRKQQELTNRIDGCSKHIGELACLYLSFLSQGPVVTFSFSDSAPWDELIHNTTEFKLDSEDEFEDEEDVEPLSDEQMDDLTTKLASDPKFQHATTKEVRRNLAQRFLKKQGLSDFIDEAPELADSAWAVFRTEIKPTQGGRAC